MWWRSILLICAAVVTTSESTGDDVSRLIRIESGQVRGYRDPDGDIFVFYGIPYATAPTGPHKFKTPLPAPVWLTPLEAVETGIVCPQALLPQFTLKSKTMQENCLIANIYVPDTDEKNLPVLVIVHGGAFQMGFGNMYTPKTLMKTLKAIIVTFNYRLGIHGFLCLGTMGAPGNAGMKDQVALLRWVKRNIASFGGNPDDVTISGYSAGSASVDLLMLSTATKGLFNKVIPESGSHLAAFSVQRDPVENAKYFAKRFNFTNVEDVYALEDFYTNLSFEQLTTDAFINRTDSTFLFSPCVECNIGEEMFLENDPVEILKSGKYLQIPLLYGFANMEGLLRINFFEYWKTKMNDNFADFLPADLQFENEDKRQKVAKTVKEFYFGDKPVSNEKVMSYVDYFSDVLITYSTLRSVRLQVEGGHDRIYLYEYSFIDDNTPVVLHTNMRGANHCAQTAVILDLDVDLGLNFTNTSEELEKMKLIMRELWSNFITTGKPVPEGSTLPAWLPVGANWSPHMSLGQTVELKGSLLEERTRFWDDIYDKYYRPAIPPPVPPARHTEF